MITGVDSSVHGPLPRGTGHVAGSRRCHTVGVPKQLPFTPLPVDFSAIDAVVFDIGGVFLYPHYSAIRRRMTELELEPPTDFEEFRRAHHFAAQQLWEMAPPDDEERREFWQVYDHAYAVALGVPAAQTAELKSAMRPSWSWPHADNIRAFWRLADAGVAAAIVSNNNGTAPRQMWDHRVCQVGTGPLPEVAAIIDSTLQGVAKPDPAIFAPALAALNTAAERTLYIGDTIHADVQGATAAGMPVAQLDPFDHHAGYGHTRLKTVADLCACLGLG